jgi:hypothetical protein
MNCEEATKLMDGRADVLDAEILPPNHSSFSVCRPADCGQKEIGKERGVTSKGRKASPRPKHFNIRLLKPALSCSTFDRRGDLRRDICLRVERKRKSETWPAVVQISWLRIFARDVF